MTWSFIWSSQAYVVKSVPRPNAWLARPIVFASVIGHFSFFFYFLLSHRRECVFGNPRSSSSDVPLLAALPPYVASGHRLFSVPGAISAFLPLDNSVPRFILSFSLDSSLRCVFFYLSLRRSSLSRIVDRFTKPLIPTLLPFTCSSSRSPRRTRNRLASP